MTLRAGLLNLMPDKALVVSEKHFAGLLGAGAGRDVSLVRHTIPEIPRGPEAAAHVQRFYRPASALQAAEMDVLVITGANVSDPCLTGQVFWQPLTAVLDWAADTGVPTLCSCLATHAVLEHRHGARRTSLPAKQWGVFDHESRRPGHCLLRGLPATVPVPHSRHNEVSALQLEAAGYDVLLESAAGGAHLAVERQHGRWLLMQGHPEYEAVSLLKEYKREVLGWQAGDRPDYPPVPAGYFNRAAAGVAAAYRAACSGARTGAADFPPFPERELASGVADTWTAPAVRIITNWLDSLA